MQDLPAIETLECFWVAAKFLNFAKAAKIVSLSPAAFGQRIRQLETYVKTPLFARSTRKITITEAGERLLPQVQKILDDVSSLRIIASDSSFVLPKNINLGTRQELGLSWILPQIQNLEKTILGLTIHLTFSGDSAEMTDLLKTGDLDAVVTSARLPDRKFSYEILHEEKYQLVCSPALLERTPIDTFEQLLELTLIDATAALELSRYWLDADKGRTHLQFKNFRFLGTIAAIREFTLYGLGVAVLPFYYVESNLKDGSLKVLFPELELLSDHFRLIYASNNRKADAIRQMGKLMRKTPLC